MYQHANKICFKCFTLLYSNLVKIALCINLRSSDLPARFTLLSASETPFFGVWSDKYFSSTKFGILLFVFKLGNWLIVVLRPCAQCCQYGGLALNLKQ